MPKRILVVDDDDDVRQMLLCALNPIAEVSEASNGPDALQKVRLLKPQLMLLDISMPEMSGIAVLQAALTIDQRIVIVMLTSECDLAVAKKTLEMGARTYITKPFDTDVVYQEIQRLIDGMVKGAETTSDMPWRVAI